MRRPPVLGTRSARPEPCWLVEHLVPCGAILAFADPDDPRVEVAFAGGADVVILLHGRGEMDDGPVLFEPHWQPGLISGWIALAPFWIRRVGDGSVRVDEGVAA
jgi:hypothetical protein